MRRTQVPAVPAEQPPSRPTQAPRITPADTSRRSLKALKRIASFYVRSLAKALLLLNTFRPHVACAHIAAISAWVLG